MAWRGVLFAGGLQQRHAELAFELSCGKAWRYPILYLMAVRL